MPETPPILPPPPSDWDADSDYDRIPKPYLAAERVGPIHIFSGMLDHIERMAFQGMTLGQIAARLGSDYATLEDAAIRYADVRLAISGGMARGVDRATGSLGRNIAAGDNASISLYLKSKGGFTTPRDAGEGNHVTINIGSQPAPITIDHVQDMAERHRRLLSSPTVDSVTAKPDPKE